MNLKMTKSHFLLEKLYPVVYHKKNAKSYSVLALVLLYHTPKYYKLLSCHYTFNLQGILLYSVQLKKHSHDLYIGLWNSTWQIYR